MDVKFPVHLRKRLGKGNKSLDLGGFLWENPKRICLSLLNRLIQENSDHCASKELKNPLCSFQWSWITLLSEETQNPFSDLKIQSWIFAKKRTLTVSYQPEPGRTLPCAAIQSEERSESVGMRWACLDATLTNAVFWLVKSWHILLNAKTSVRGWLLNWLILDLFVHFFEHTRLD